MITHIKQQNALLRQMSDALYAEIARHGELVVLTTGTQVEAAGIPAAHVYFPINSTLGLTVSDGQGRTAEAAMIGRHELSGTHLICTGTPSSSSCVVTIGGQALRLSSETARGLFAESVEFREIVLTFMQALIVQLSYNSLCQRFHRLEQRYARWLLEADDRVQGGDLLVTHELSASMLGVQRAGLTCAANDLARRRLIIKRRGVTTISDRPGLELSSCDCYAELRREYTRLFQSVNGSAIPG